MSTGESTTTVGKDAAQTLQDLSTAAQDAIKGDGTGKAAALAKAMEDARATVSAEGAELLERLVSYEAKSGFGIETLLSAVVGKAASLAAHIGIDL